MIRVRFFKSFDETLDELPRKDQLKAQAALSQLLDYFSGGAKPLGLGLRKLRGNYWEIRISIDRRIIFLLKNDLASFILVGNHNEISRYLNRHS